MDQNNIQRQHFELWNTELFYSLNNSYIFAKMFIFLFWICHYGLFNKKYSEEGRKNLNHFRL